MPREQQDAVFDTVAHINNGTKPSGPTGEKWATKFKNKERELPTEDANGNEITYAEYRVAAPSHEAGAGTKRVVVGSDGRVYFTGTHYGTANETAKAFVRIK